MDKHIHNNKVWPSDVASAASLTFASLALTLGLGLGYLLLTGFYNVFLHPLRGFPGPKLWAVTSIPYIHMYLSGEVPRRILELHKTYGPIVRVAPEIISISHPDAMKELRGHRKHGTGEHEKDPIQFADSRHNIIGANREDHARFRRTMAHAFSAQAMLDQQIILKSYVDRLLGKLRARCDSGSQSLNMVNWYNYATFDIIGDLAFGESFGCLDNANYHPWVSLVFASIKNMAYSVSIKRYPMVAPLLKYFIPKEVATKWAEHYQLSHEKVKKRLALRSERPDFIEMMKQGSKAGDMTLDELTSNASVLIIAGSETTATVLSAATYFLATNPPALEKLIKEIRSVFEAEEDIGLVSLQNTPYLLAVLNETLRMYPPAPNGHPRKISQGGAEIIGAYFPEGTLVEIWQWALYRNPEYFERPNDFIAERWLGDERFANDQKDAFQPFSHGPRNCIGRNLAYAEMRFIMARIIWNFDIKLSKTSEGWAEKSKVYILWEKPPLEVYLIPRNDLVK